MYRPRCLLHRLVRGLAHRIATRRGESGAAALEFGLVFPVVLMVIFGIIQYGYHFWSLHTASASAREAARRLIVGTDWDCTRTIALGHADSPAVGSTPPEVTREYHTDGGAAQTAPVVGSLVTVTVTFQSLDLDMPFLPLPDGGVVSQSQTGRVESVPPQRLKCDETQDYVEGTGTY